LETDWKKEVKAVLLLGSEQFVDRMKGLLKGDQREQTTSRQARTKALSWEQITQAVAKAWGTEWEIAKQAHGSRALACGLARQPPLLGRFIAGTGPISWSDGIPRGNHGNPSI
jgi:hypothetical protein